MLEAIKLTKRYGDTLALDGLDLRILPGEIFCLLGANGAGKTTTINLFLGFIAPTSGSVRINNLDVVQHPLQTKRHIAYIPEQVMLYGNLSGLENLRYFADLAGRSCTDAELRQYFERVGLGLAAAERRVSTYSKGMRQKVGIAIALAKQAEALLLDEPTSGLDPKASNEFSNLLRQLSSSKVAILMATHDLFRTKETGTRIGIMDRGRLTEVVNPDSISHGELERIYLEHLNEAANRSATAEEAAVAS